MPQVYLLYKNSHPGGQGWLVGLLCYELSPLLGPVVLRLCAALHLVYSLLVLCLSVDCVRFVSCQGQLSLFVSTLEESVFVCHAGGTIKVRHHVAIWGARISSPYPLLLGI